MRTFDLITRPWIPVRQGNEVILVNLEQSLLEAHQYTRIEDPSPLVTTALYRFLLASLHRALEGPADAYEAAEWFKKGFDAGKIRDYLTKYQDCFDLFHPKKPFYQVPDFTLERSSRSWTVLAPELNSDNNKVLFDHTVTSRPRPLYPDEAARLLVANQNFALSAGKSVLCHTSTAPVATAALAIMLGENLHQTLCLNLVSYPKSEYGRDFATWEHGPVQVAAMEDCEAAKGSPKGIVHRYTWLSRSIRLEPENMDDQTVVRWISYASGVRYEDSRIRNDPMVRFRTDPKDPGKTYPLGFFGGKGLWRDFASLLPKPGSAQGLDVIDHARNVYRALGRGFKERSIPVMVSGQANDQAKIELWRGEIYRLPEAILSEADLHVFVKQSLEEAEEMGQALNSAARVLAEQLLTLGERKPHKDDVSKLTRSFPHQSVYWTGLEAHFAHWIQQLGMDFEEQQTWLGQEWRNTLRQEALKAWQMTVLAAGDDARALRAIQKSGGILMSKIFKKEVAGAKRS